MANHSYTWVVIRIMSWITGHSIKTAYAAGRAPHVSRLGIWYPGRSGAAPGIWFYTCELDRNTYQMLGMQGDGTLDHLMFSKTYNSGDALRMIRHVHKKYEKIYCLMDNAGANTAADVLKYAAGSGGGVVLRYTLPHTPQLNPIEPQWNVLRRMMLAGRYFASVEDLRAVIAAIARRRCVPSR